MMMMQAGKQKFKVDPNKELDNDFRFRFEMVVHFTHNFTEKIEF